MNFLISIYVSLYLVLAKLLKISHTKASTLFFLLIVSPLLVFPLTSGFFYFFIIVKLFFKLDDFRADKVTLWGFVLKPKASIHGINEYRYETLIFKLLQFPQKKVEKGMSIYELDDYIKENTGKLDLREYDLTINDIREMSSPIFSFYNFDKKCGHIKIRDYEFGYRGEALHLIFENERLVNMYLSKHEEEFL